MLEGTRFSGDAGLSDIGMLSPDLPDGPTNSRPTAHIVAAIAIVWKKDKNFLNSFEIIKIGPN